MSMQPALVSSVLAALLACVAAGQSLPPEDAAPIAAPGTQPDLPAAGSAPAVTLTAQGIASRAIARVAMADLKLQTDPATNRYADERDYRVAAEIIEVAHQLNPADQDILRLLIQAWTSAGDAQRVDELNRVLIRLDPRDTVTQLALVSTRINRLQNVDERLAAYEKFLGSEGAALDPGIRSRLAMDAALLKRERGDDMGFARTLATACQLDPTNKDAATLALTYFADRVPDVIGRFELLTNVLKADPFDPEVHAAMAEELASAGAVRAASRFYITLRALRNARGEQLSAQEIAEILVSEWNLDGADALIRKLTGEIESGRAELRNRRERIAASGELLAEVADPAEVRLTVPFERTRVIASAALGDPELISYAVAEAEETFRRILEILATPDKRPEGMTEEQAAFTIQSLKTERVWLRLWSGRTTDQAAAEIEELRTDPKIDAATLARMEACLKMRQGRLDEAAKDLAALSRQDILAAVAMGILAEIREQKDQAVALYSQLSERLSGSLAGAFCRTRVIQLTGKAPSPTDTARKLQTVADSIPTSIEAMIADPRRFVDLRVQTVSSEVGLLDKIEIKITLTNTSNFPLAFGPDQPINSRFLLSPIVDIGVRRLALPGLQEVVWLNRRLRLMPREQFEATVWADPGILGGVLQRLGGTSARIRWRVVQGFKLNRTGFYEPGAMCLSTETPTIARPPSSRSSASFATLNGWIERGTTVEMAESIFAFIERITTPPAGQPEVTPEDLSAFIAAATARYRTANRAEKAILIAFCPTALQAPPFAALDAEITRETDDGLLKCFLGIRVPTADSPLLAPDAWTSRPELQGFADLARARLADGKRTIATLGGREGTESTTPDAPPAPAPSGR